MKKRKLLLTMLMVVVALTGMIITSYAQVTTLSSGTYYTASSNTAVSVQTINDLLFINGNMTEKDSRGIGVTSTSSSFTARATSLLYKNCSYYSSDVKESSGMAIASAEYIGYGDAPYLTHFETTHKVWSPNNDSDRVFSIATFVSNPFNGQWESTDNHLLYVS